MLSRDATKSAARSDFPPWARTKSALTPLSFFASNLHTVAPQDGSSPLFTSGPFDLACNSSVYGGVDRR
jgi:hypothetical protein